MKKHDTRQADWFKGVMMNLPDMTDDELVEQYNYTMKRHTRKERDENEDC